MLVPLYRHVVQWERADPPWELPDYVGKFAQSLEETQAWIVSGGVAAPVVVAPLRNLPPTDPTLLVPSDSESEVGASDEELPTPKHLLSKVQWSDEVEHVLDKGAWATTPAMHVGWNIFVYVSWTFSYFRRPGTDRRLSRAS